jgi:hypothetical protein
MNAIQEVKDENIRKIAQTLRSSGLASSETEAVRMANAMSKTSQKVTQNFDDRNRFATGASKLNTETQVSDQTHTVSFNQAPTSMPITSGKQASFATLNDVISAPEKRIEVKEEFIFGETGKEDVFAVKNEFEEVISQDIIGVKTAPTIVVEVKSEPVAVPVHAPIVSSTPAPAPRPAAKGVYIQEPIKTPWHPPRPVTGVSKQTMMPVSRAEPLNLSPQKFDPVERIAPMLRTAPAERPDSSMQNAAPAQSASPSGGQVSASQSSQNAFSILLGSAQKNAAYEEEVRKHAPQQTTTQQVTATTNTVAQPQRPAVSTTEFAQTPGIIDGKTQVSPLSSAQSAPHSVAQPAVSPQKKMMMEANVDISKMFNFNK